MATSVTWSALLHLLLLLGVASFTALGGGRMDEGETMIPGEALVSFGCTLTLNKDDCQVLFFVDGILAWSSNNTVTYGVSDCALTLRDDGDLILHSKSRGQIWHSNTAVGPMSFSFYALKVSGRMLLARIVRLHDDSEVELQQIWTTTQDIE